jgi:hypothetical protein
MLSNAIDTHSFETFYLEPKLSDLLGQLNAMIDWMPVEDPAFIGDPSSRTRSGTGMPGTHGDLFVIPAKAGIQRA